MLFTPQRYKIADQIDKPFIDIDEIYQFLNVSPTEQEVRRVVEKSKDHNRLSLAEVAILLNAPDRQIVLTAAAELKKAVYGNRIVLFAPLYVGNMCTNRCDYCSFASDVSSTQRKTLAHDELVGEVDALAAEGHKRLILVYGEHPKYSAGFIADNVREVYCTGKIRRVNINAAPLGVDGFRTVADSGIGTYQIFQETYNREIYQQHHLGGMKADYDWRLTAFDRAMTAGIDDVGLGVLFGLNPEWKQEVMGLVRHTNHLEALFNVGPHTLSFPRMNSAEGASPTKYPISDEDFIFAIAVLRLAVPYTGLILTARESHELRTRAIEYGVSQIDGGSKLEIGGYCEDEAQSGGAQFALNDERSLGEVIDELIATDRIPSFCTACYRLGRTGEHFMEFSTKGFIKRFCTPNAVLTLAEYLEDFAKPATKVKGYELIEREIVKLEGSDEARAMVPKLRERLEAIKGGTRDLYF